MKRSEYDRIVRLGFYAVTPFVIVAAAMWISPFVLPQHMALDLERGGLVYGALLAALFAGVGICADLTGASPAGGRRSLTPAIVAFFVAFLAIIPNGFFFFGIGAAWRYLILLLTFLFLLMRDLDAVRAGQLPQWYGDLRSRLTFWIVLSSALTTARLMLWGYY